MWLTRVQSAGCLFTSPSPPRGKARAGCSLPVHRWCAPRCVRAVGVFITLVSLVMSVAQLLASSLTIFMWLLALLE